MMIMPADAELPNNPRIGWRNVVPDASSITATQEATGFLVANLLNPATFLSWKGTSAAAQSITIQLASAQELDYLGIARHNLGTAGIEYTLETSSDGETWTAITDATHEPADDGVIFHQFTPTTSSRWRLSLAAGSAAPQIAVLYLGAITVLKRRIYVGHTPINLGRRRRISTGRSEDGQFLGRHRLSTTLESRLSLQNLDPDWYRDELDGFVEDGDIDPFFWAWRPDDFPDEVAYCWTMDDPVPVNQRANGMMQIDFSIQGIT